MSNIFKAYDVRGIYPEEINTDIAKRLGNAVVRYLKAHSTDSEQAKKIVVGEDGRISSPELRQAVVEGITSAGADVVYIGQCTTPLFYFAVNTAGTDGGVMVTASHNPAEYNGFKIVGKESVPIGLASGLLDIKSLMDVAVPDDMISGSVDHREMIDDYINVIVELSGASEQDFSHLRVVIDSSNGMTSMVLKNLLRKINLHPTTIFFDIDGTFPNHSPDISRLENLSHLSDKVRELRADLGVAFDGDGDRIMLIDNLGNVVQSDYLLGLLFQMMGKPKTVYDLRISRFIKELLGDKGFPSATGYVSIKKTMREHDAELGGELSGHFSFKKLHFSESAVMVMLKVLTMLNNSSKTISETLKPFQKYFNSGEINLPLPDAADKKAMLSQLKISYQDGKINEMDGVTIEYPKWWFNVRFSNTEPLVRIVVEADTKKLMEEKKKELIQALSSF